ncbi:hypothetical protein ASE00_12470 [Sphingomonas sp. Root710]|uniref:LysR substrate-binding domain-containing protein n=1 Tax=Sphingomonas sp. Root710 TaxID=1736594 RepID=UPI0006FA7535|nr:LysR substrate-binding domain-containing protein [Sphingomonas sp. Root710]KRB82827.1 hypothetical protein ASE00_12470 [Sphingomonas sp. Root710]
MSAKPTPPFTALRAIEAAVRHRSYTWAAKELAITHSAISQAVKRLEGELGTKLFERRGSAMEPSSAALQLAEAYADAAVVLSRSLERVAKLPPADRLVIAMPPAFGRLWFSPRLPRLSAAFPDITIEVRTALNAETTDESNLVISLGPPPGDGWSIERLCDITLEPWCSPDFAKAHRIKSPADVLNVPLIAERGLPWSLWLNQLKIAGPAPRSGHIFDDSSMLLDAAQRGEGLALSPRLLSQPYLVAGALLCPVPIPASAGVQLFASWRGRPGSRQTVDRFMTWLRSEMPLR